MRLLNVLNLRDDLTAEEVVLIAGKLNDNIHSLRALRSIARRNNITFPDVGNVKEIEARFESAEAFALKALNSMNKPDTEMTYQDRLFWTSPGKGPAAKIFGALDLSQFSAEQIKDASIAGTVSGTKSTATSSRIPKNYTVVMLMGNENAVNIAEQFHTTVQAIQQLNPGKDISSLAFGEQLNVPGTTMAMLKGPGYVQPEQCKTLAMTQVLEKAKKDLASRVDGENSVEN